MFYNIDGITSVFFYTFYRRTISILYRIRSFRHITSTFANTCIVVHTVLFAIKRGTTATRGVVALLLALLLMLPSMFEFLFCLFDLFRWQILFPFKG